MTKDDYDAFIDIVDKTALIKGIEFTCERADAWFDELKGFRLEAVRVAFVWCRREKQWFPDLADIVAYARGWEEGHPAYSKEYLEDLARQRRAGEKNGNKLGDKADELFDKSSVIDIT